MNRCEEKHEPKYKITYKSAKGMNYCPVWLVCEECYEKSPFSSDDYLPFVEPVPSKIPA